MTTIRRPAWRECVVLVAVAAALGGCATTAATQQATPRPGVYRAIAIVPVFANANPALAGISPTTSPDVGKAALTGLCWGALSASSTGALLTFVLLGGPAGIAAVPVIAAGAAGAAALGFVGGYANVASEVAARAEAVALQNAVTSAAPIAASPNAMADTIAGGITRWTPYRAQAFASGMTAADRSAARFRADGFDAVLQVEITQFGFAGRAGSREVAVYMTAEARLVDAAGGQTVAARGLAYLSPWHGTDWWTSQHGTLTRTELARASRTLAERIVEHLFLHTRWLAEDSPRANVCGVLPLATPEAVPPVGPGPPAPVKVDGVTPRLAWNERLAAALVGGPPAGIVAEDLRYDLRVYEELDWAPGPLVYEREGLAGREHRLDTELKPATLYFWTVRARYALDGEPRATRWSATAEPATLDPLAPQLVYASQPGDAATLRCTARTLSPCGCLDFIPTPNWFRFRTP